MKTLLVIVLFPFKCVIFALWWTFKFLLLVLCLLTPPIGWWALAGYFGQKAVDKNQATNDAILAELRAQRDK